MSARFPYITQAQLISAVEETVLWQQGSERSWTCDAIISADLLEGLVRLASKAPYRYKKEFMDGF